MEKAIILILLGSSLSFLSAQSRQEMEQMRAVIPSQKTKRPDFFAHTRNNQSEYQVIASGLFLFYKTFISSQDGNRCSFHPSCSVYAIEIIKKNGWLLGSMATFDRLTRCNSLSPEWYEKDSRKKLLIDRP